MTIFFMLLLAGATLAIAVFPLIKPPLEAGPVRYSGEDELQVLRRKKEIVYGNIKDLDFEYKMGKLGELDYQRLRNELKLEAALLMESMDRTKKGRSADDALEAEISARRTRNKGAAERLVPSGVTLSDSGVSPGGQCPRCQTPYAANSKFCAECGFHLQS